MKVSSLALGAVILLHGHQHQHHQFVNAFFVPSHHQRVIGKQKHQRRGPISSSTGSPIPFAAPTHTTTTTSIFTATSSSSSSLNEDLQIVQTQLRLEYAPISPFGKNAGPPLAGGKHILGGKGANLAEMSELGLSVPPGFTITTECCDKYCNEWDQTLPPELWNQIVASLTAVEHEMNSQFGSPENPLLLSVRSGAAISMPGMMDTVLNLGMNDQVVEGLANKTGNARFAWDSYRRFLEMFGNVVLEIPRSLFEDELDDIKYEKGVNEDTDLTAEDLKEVVGRFKKVYETMDTTFPQDVLEQLRLSIGAVFKGWMGDRAIKYREVEQIRSLLGTAVNCQAMVFGNMGDTSGTGVSFSRDPNTGSAELFGEFLINAQGEDVVAGIRTPRNISELKGIMPEVYEEFVRNTQILEKKFGDMQDIEFTIQEGKLYMLQTRNGKRGGEAAVKIAVDLVEEGLITKEQAVQKVLPEHLDQLLHPRFPDVEMKEYKKAVLTRGLPASPGAAVGRIALTNEQVVANKEKGFPSIMVRDETSPDDVEGMYSAEGILTARGGMTSHAAVVARGWGKPCVCGCTSLSVDEHSGEIVITLDDGSQKTFKEGDFLSLNGQTGEVLEGEQAVAPPAITGNLKTFMDWVDEIRDIDVLTNADTPADAKEARKNGANGIGLCRSEHMFFKPERISKVRQLILGDDKQADAALKDLLQFQREDYEGIFKEMDGLPVTVRLLDPPLHEFLPSVKESAVMAELAKQLGTSIHELTEKVESMEEVNPMLGLRGCRLGITRPSIIEMQTRAILEAALNAIEAGVDARPDIMVPLVGKVEEFRNQKELIQSVAKSVFEERGKSCAYKIGTMIEIPRAALTAHEISEEAEFFSFGSNDLTQMTFGYSRDDVGSFVPSYLSKGILQDDPFVSLDTEGVGQLIKMTVERGRGIKPDLKIGVCGEHGGDPRSVRFFSNEAGLSYVSCSPFRVPIARLAAAQASVENKSEFKP
ncbi:pyruvate phosphate dikinase [Nitzschia inconspicua]|uniref:pyruvate, phosphate dikinase n=1 Tax=Nitzschia inconspicua TaxID=303405 RepID=A0A9K3LKJ3_9STRA|nr:pyruvate phosphate dikinase [Nitzschia inconspicua]